MDNNNSDEPTLASIFQYMKNMAEENKTTSNLVKDLTSRINTLEDDNITSSIHKRRVDTGKGGPFKKAKLSSINDPVVVNSDTFVVDNMRQAGPIISGPVVQTYRSENTSTKQAVPTISEPIARSSVSKVNVDLNNNTNPLVIDSYITDDNYNLEQEGENIRLEELEQIYLSNENSDISNIAPRLDNEVFTTVDTALNIDHDQESGLPIITSKLGSNWALKESTIKWFRTVADLELDEDQVATIEDQYVPSEECVEDFMPPPHIPSVFWNKIKTNSSELFKQRAMYKSQKLSTLALKPLLSVIDKLDRGDPIISDIASSIQLICAANLQLR